MTYDICIIGSGAGASPIAYEMAKEGKRVCILEKGAIYTEKDFSKDELAFVRRDIFTPNLNEEYHTIEEFIDEQWYKFPTYETGWSFWNGNMLGGSSNFMSGFFYRLKPNDFKLASTYGVAKGSNAVDWPISYDELEPYYDKVEKVIGVSGEVTPYEHQEPRSSKNFPYKPLQEHPIVKLIDSSCAKLNFTSIKTPRAIISEQKGQRNPCYYSNYCGSYACSSGAKSSGRASLLQEIIALPNVTIIGNAQVFKLNTDNHDNVTSASYFTKAKTQKEIKAKIFVVACQAAESSRLLLNSKSKNFPKGLANNSGNVGKNFLSTGGGFLSGEFDQSNLPQDELMTTGFFVNRALKDWYFTKKFKGGMIELLFEHANPIKRANTLASTEEGVLWGKALQDKLHDDFTKKRRLSMEIFTDWTPNDNAFISVDDNYKDKYGIPVANIRIGAHKQDMQAAEFLAQKGIMLLKEMGAKNITKKLSPLPSQNLQAGGCRFGNDPKNSVLNKHCQAHEVKNLFVTDASFMPTGGSVPYTFTIYANSFRVADYIKEYSKTL
jgi:choline dehydrogenase-like flavoprotein